MKTGDLVRSSRETSLFASVGVVVNSEPRLNGNWVRVLFTSELGKTFAPVDGIFLIREDHLKVISESR